MPFFLPLSFQLLGEKCQSTILFFQCSNRKVSKPRKMEKRLRRRRTLHSWLRNKFLQFGYLCEVVTEISVCHWNLGDTSSTLKGSESKGWVELSTSVLCLLTYEISREGNMREKLETNCWRYDNDDGFSNYLLSQDPLLMWNELNTFLYNRGMFSL